MGLEGTWYNELGSSMTIDAVSDGAFDLTYETAVSASDCAVGRFDGSGRSDDSAAGLAVAFVVAWSNERSGCGAVTSWSGELRTVGGEETLVAMWLLVVPNEQYDWASTIVGQDIFTRTPAPQGLVEESVAPKRHSHP